MVGGGGEMPLGCTAFLVSAHFLKSGVLLGLFSFFKLVSEGTRAGGTWEGRENERKRDIQNALCHDL